MKFYQSAVLQNLSKFPRYQDWLEETPKGLGLARNPGDMFLVWKICEYFKPKTILEVGFAAGQSAGLYVEAGGNNPEITCIDIDLEHVPFFNSIFPHNNINFIKSYSQDVALTNNFDFIMIDGDHDYEGVLADFENFFPLLHKNSILCMDEYNFQEYPGVTQVINEHLLGQHDWVPFLAGVQGMFFHHRSHSADDFLDNFLQIGADNFIDFSNVVDWNGHTVLFSKCPYIFSENNQIFLDALKFYNL